MNIKKLAITFLTFLLKLLNKHTMTLTSQYEIGQTVTDPKTGKTGTIASAGIVYTLDIPEEVIPATQITGVELPE